MIVLPQFWHFQAAYQVNNIYIRVDRYLDGPNIFKVGLLLSADTRPTLNCLNMCTHTQTIPVLPFCDMACHNSSYEHLRIIYDGKEKGKNFHFVRRLGEAKNSFGFSQSNHILLDVKCGIFNP
jgi:hypothetical protein